MSLISILLCLCCLTFANISAVRLSPADSILEGKLQEFIAQGSSENTLPTISETITKHFENSGYPFAHFTLHYVDDTLKVSIEKNNLYYFGSLYNAGESRSSDSIISRYALTPVNQLFSESILKKIQKRLNRAPYFSVTPYTDLLRHPERSILYPSFKLYDNTINSIELLFAYTNDESPLTSNIQVDIYNILGTMRDLNFLYTTNDNTTEMLLNYKEPWILHSEVDGSIKGNLLEIDSTYQKLSLELGAIANISFENRFGIYLGVLSFSEQKESSANIRYWSRLDFNTDTRDRSQFPTQGYEYYTSLSIFSSKDDQEYSTQWEGFVHSYHSLNSKFVFHPKFRWGTILSNEPVSPVESFLLGGTRSIRGFRENHFISQSYSVAPIEIQYRYTTKSALYIFTDPLLHNPTISSRWNVTIGYGMGIKQKSGAFTIGLEFASNPALSFSQTLIHVSAKNYF